MHHAAHISMDVATRGATIFGALQLSIAGYREQEARRRRDGVYAVADLEMRLSESRQIEAEAIDAATAIAAENDRLRRELAAARAHAAQMEAAVISYVERNGLI